MSVGWDDVDDGDPRTTAELFIEYFELVDEIVDAITPEDTQRSLDQILARVHGGS